MNVTFLSGAVDDTTRTRALLSAFALIAVAVGVFAANGSVQALIMIAVFLLASIAAMTVPLTALPILLAALVPFQFYFFIAGTNYAMRVAVVFLAVAALRVLLERGIRASLRGQIWIAPAVLFLFAAFIAAFAASSKYDAFKGIYEWLAIFASLFVAARTVHSTRTLKWMIFILLIGGTLQGILGLVEYVAGLDRVFRVLALPVSGFFIQPNLLRARLDDFSFNWILFGRAVPFGTFINGIDYAIFLAAIFLLALALAFSQLNRLRIGLWLGCAFIIGAALLLTFKGSGFIALVGGALALALCFAPRLSRRMLVLVSAIFLLAVLFTAPFAESISQRAVFLVQREQDQVREVGRLRIWLNLFSPFAQQPLFGYGLNNSEFLAEPTRTLRGGAFAFNPTSPESAYVQVLIETGAVGFFALMSFFALSLARAYRRARAGVDTAVYGGIFAALVAILLGNLTVSGFTTDQNGMLMGILVGLVFAEWNTP